ncbi:MAG: universal stress protein [Bacteroidota bacterium]
MKNILVPTDYSETARNAYWYARELAFYFEANLSVMHVYHPSFDPASPYAAMTPDYQEENHRQLLQSFIEDYQSSDMGDVVATTMVSPELRLGFAAEEIVAASKKESLDLIVMGTTGQGGFLEKLFGRVSLQVSREAHCPVLLVPNGYKFGDLDHIVYASNYESADSAILREIVAFADKFSAAIHLVHVNESHKKGDYKLEELLLEQLFTKNGLSLEFSLETVQAETAWAGLKQYIEEHEVDLLVVATKHRKLWDRLTHKSMTKRMLEGVQVPILVMPIL